MKVRITIAIEKRILHELDCEAEKEGRSRSNYIEWLLKDYLEITSHGDSSRTDKTEV